jgi:hypothetical protein
MSCATNKAIDDPRRQAADNEYRAFVHLSLEINIARSDGWAAAGENALACSFYLINAADPEGPPLKQQFIVNFVPGHATVLFSETKN